MTFSSRVRFGQSLCFIAIAGLAAGCATEIIEDPESADPMALTWVSPGPMDHIEAGDAIELAVMTQNADARIVHFSVDGREVGVCGSTDSAEQDCRLADRWRWTTMIATTGTHRLEAWFDRASAPRVHAELMIQVDALTVDPNLDPDASVSDDAESTEDAAEDAFELFPLDAGFTPDAASVDARSADARTADAAITDVRVDSGPRDSGPRDSGPRDSGPPPPPPPPPPRGFLDPDRGFHNIFGGISWAVRGQTVDLHTADPAGSISSIASCMSRYGASIRRWGDRLRISRASIVATAITESNCTNPAGSSDGLSSGPMQVTATTCAAVMGLSSSTCRSRMHSSPDFSFEVGVRYMASSYQRRQHLNDPPKIAAAYNAGSLRSSSANRWHMIVTGNHIDRFTAAYNSYRAWERRSGLGVDFAPDEMFFNGEHVATVGELPSGVREGQTYFVGDWSHRDGEFYLFFNGEWQRSVQ